MKYYFAYGSNMAKAVFHGRVVGEPAGRAALEGHRLAFSLPSQRWGGRAADLAILSGAEVWGRLWCVDEDQLAVLDRFEGAYQRLEVTVARIEEQGGKVRTEEAQAITYVVRDDRRAPDEGTPAPEYLGQMLKGADECGLPAHYIRFLSAAASYVAEPLRVVGTRDRSAARGFPLARVNPAAKNFRSRMGYVEVEGRQCLVHVEASDQVPAGTLELDQRVREALGIGGRVSPGWPGRIGPVAQFRRH